MTLEMRRLMWRLDIGNHFNPTKSSSIGHFYTWYLFFGNGGYSGTSTGGFGGIDDGFRFYPICITYPQPNTVYQVDRITIVGEGSDYSNFIEQKFYATFCISVSGWDDLEVSNIDMGYSDYDGNNIY